MATALHGSARTTSVLPCRPPSRRRAGPRGRPHRLGVTLPAPQLRGKFTGPIRFPASCRDERECLAYAVAFSRQRRLRTYLNVSGLERYWIAGGGESVTVSVFEFHVRPRRKDLAFVHEEKTTDVPLP